MTALAQPPTSQLDTEDLTTAANELLRELNQKVFQDSIDITKLGLAVGLVEDFAQKYASSTWVGPDIWIVEWSFAGKNKWAPIKSPPFQSENLANAYPKRQGFEYRIMRYVAQPPTSRAWEPREGWLQRQFDALKPFLCMRCGGTFSDSYAHACPIPTAPPSKEREPNAKP